MSITSKCLSFPSRSSQSSLRARSCACRPQQHVQRAWLPLKIYPISAGVKGGLAGGVAMALLAMLYGLIVYRSIWYPINLHCR